MVIDSLETQTISLSPEMMADVWDNIEDHIAMEKETIRLMDDSMKALKGKKMVVQEYLLTYLKFDEEKHDVLLEALEKIKKGMYPYG